MLDFLKGLNEEWLRYIESAGVRLQRVASESVQLEKATFAGVSRRMPRIKITDRKEDKPSK